MRGPRPPCPPPRTGPLKVGDKVRLKRNYQPTGTRIRAHIVQFIEDVEGGVVLDKYLESFRCWNVEHLERA